MSGICGIIRFDGKPVKKEEIKRMLDSMKNRGSDSQELWVDGNVGFGHKMLWVTPESLHESQPTVSEDGDLVITADARIDNREELLGKLEIDENDFTVITDVDLILWSYKKWGEDCSKFLTGDFAFSIWDKKRQELYAARDYMGIKPYFYYLDDKIFVFASEVNPINKVLYQKNEINFQALKIFSKYGAIGCDETFTENIYRLKAFHRLWVNKNNNIKITRFWFPETIKINYNMTLENAMSGFRDQFFRSIKSKLRSITPVGIELSGGLDSSSVTAVAAHLSETNELHPISHHYGDMSCDEREYSVSVLKHFGLDALCIDADKIEYGKLAALDKWNSLNPEYPGSGNFLSCLYKLELLQKNEIRVVLTGHGGDHLMTGNGFFFKDYILSGQMKSILRELKERKYSPYFIASQLQWFLPSRLRKVIRNFLGKFNEDEFYSKICADNFPLKTDTYQFQEIQAYAGLFYQFWIDFNPNKVAGKYGIEVRHPFFDKRLFEFMLTVPNFYKKNENITKYLLKESLKDLLPKKIYYRNDKAEFSELVNIQYKLLKCDEMSYDNVIEFGLALKNEIEAYKNETNDELWYNSDKLDRMWHLCLIEKWLIYSKKEGDKK